MQSESLTVARVVVESYEISWRSGLSRKPHLEPNIMSVDLVVLTPNCRFKYLKNDGGRSRLRF